MPLDEQLLTTIMSLGSQQKIRDIADIFGQTDSCSFKSCKNITKLLTESLMPQVIKWPEHAQYLNMSTVFNTNGFDGIVGCIYGTHINIPAPAVDGISYFNRKQTHSLFCCYKLFVMLICHSCMFWLGGQVGYTTIGS